MINNHLADLISKLNFAKVSRLKTIKVRNIKLIKQILHYFYSLGIIKSFNIINNKEISVKLKWIGGNMVFGKIILIAKPSKISNISVIKIFKSRKNNLEPMISLISTSKGIQLDTNCILKREGGKNLIKILIL